MCDHSAGSDATTLHQKFCRMTGGIPCKAAHGLGALLARVTGRSATPHAGCSGHGEARAEGCGCGGEHKTAHASGEGCCGGKNHEAGAGKGGCGCGGKGQAKAPSDTARS